MPVRASHRSLQFPDPLLELLDAREKLEHNPHSGVVDPEFLAQSEDLLDEGDGIPRRRFRFPFS
jgi:hypothetical protein